MSFTTLGGAPKKDAPKATVAQATPAAEVPVVPRTSVRVWSSFS